MKISDNNVKIRKSAMEQGVPGGFLTWKEVFILQGGVYNGN